MNIGIGLNTGPASVGNFGSAQRFTYSCLGDDVNLASRLESQCKAYGVGIIVGAKTQMQVGEYATVELDRVMVKGRTEPERIFALLGNAGLAQSAGYRALVDRQAAFLLEYRAGRFTEALERIGACQAAAAAIDWQQGYYEMMARRIDTLILDPPSNWTGIHVAGEK